MKTTDFSPQFSEVWGENADSSTITYPIPSTTSVSGRASLDAGFSNVNMTDLAAGGIPPYGQDFNGILKMLSTSAQNYEAGNVPAWSAAFASDIDGYPEYALVQYSGKFYVSTADANTTTPGASGSSWKLLSSGLAALSDWTTSPGQNGYRICPDGEIEMWGIATVPATGVTFAQINFTFPIAFPNECYGVNGNSMNIAQVSTSTDTGGGWPSVSGDLATVTGARLTAECFGQYKFTNTVKIFWRARGR